MASLSQWKKDLLSGAFDSGLEKLYGSSLESILAQRARYTAVLDGFLGQFGPAPDAFFFSAPGRVELGGNHTDHQHGHVLAAAIHLDSIACAAPRDSKTIRIYSEGFPLAVIPLDDLLPSDGERGTSAALARGVAAGFAQKGWAAGGSDIYVSSLVPEGSGLSSSASFEVLLGAVFNELFCGGCHSFTEIARIAQKAENHYFGKPCGLMDQTACAAGGVTAMDFADSDSPVLRPVRFDFSTCGHALCLIDTGKSHAQLTEEYAAIPAEMGAVAACFGCQTLRQVSQQQFWAGLSRIRETAGDRAALRAIHFYGDDQRAIEEATALERGDFPAFLRLIKESGRSSFQYLQNVSVPGSSKRQEMALALALCEKLLGGKGAFRVHGGGFAGAIQAFVPQEMLAEFCRGMEALCGPGSCRTLSVRPAGACGLKALLA
ncbi:MAG: galactokinase family protein [Oscillospiraceae bacterium]|nr:galactokinase family protein [Oscillospiraceae bacterium]